MEASAQRFEGFARAMRRAGLPVEPGLVVEGNFLPSGGRANDLMAVGCYEALKELGERIGETIAVMGYDDQEIAQHLSPGLSTVLLPHREMGAWCVRTLLAGDDIRPEQTRLPCPVVLRGSHRRG